ncbi:hypothetical protein COT27_01790 [Candidatus Kuenenbacteria bacterium CG08_land_8_20_14_0_20_37_23]|uniref:LysM domain-containing protein n=2 Tax=Candidatus Kueneniibacteriota TaxID=1752740 RepID=A0A2M6XSS0_9BACT|nr:MAG: hypothetical protein AUJ29_01200 [Candidatus Kuenenbacteria bacterium CG1_02_38_13]PIU10688.1 MAG: hypothetical protein COT27_01790 [Candidatus Kuenenbacteria bacterium CG08_land_8_20_14_0_20_37_23]
MAEMIINIIIAKSSRLARNIGKSLWSFIFQLFMVPVYRFFLFLKKYLDRLVLRNPLLSLEQNRKNMKSSFLLHIVMLVLVVIVLIGNIKTRETYAEEFGKNSIMAQLMSASSEEEIVEKSKPIQEWSDQPKTENILEQMSAIGAKIITDDNQQKDGEINGKVVLAQGGEALIKPTITPFEKEATGESNFSFAARNEIRYYYVKEGDTLSAIAEKFGISINTILWENNLSLSSYIRPGDKLTILPTTGISYAVKAGDTLSAIAKEFGTDIEKVVAFNNLDPVGLLRVRQKIIIPDGKLGYINPAPSKLLGSMKNIFSENPETPSAKNFLWPSVSKKITQYYHWRHLAIDIGANAGSPIYSARSGRIEKAGWSTGYGYNIVIDHGGGIKTLYAHARALYVKRGDQVEQGEILGEVGSTGWSTGPHIHFELTIGGTKVNPLSYL